MRWTEAIERILSLVLVWFVAVSLLHYAIQPDRPEMWVYALTLLFTAIADPQTTYLVLTGIALLYILVGLKILLDLWRGFRSPELWSMQTESGRIGVTCDAVKQLIVHYCNALPVVVQTQPSVSVVRGQLVVRLAVKAKHISNRSTTEICKQVQAAGRDCITGILGISDIASVHVTVTKVEVQETPHLDPITPADESPDNGTARSLAL